MKTIIACSVIACLFLCETSHAQRSVKSEGVRLTLTSVKVLEDTLFFAFRLSNYSLLRYHLSHVRCYTQDRSTPKRTAVQQTYQEPIDSLQLKPVSARSATCLVIPYLAFTVPNRKNLFIQVGETSNTRRLQLKLSGRRFRRMIRQY